MRFILRKEENQYIMVKDSTFEIWNINEDVFKMIKSCLDIGHDNTIEKYLEFKVELIELFSFFKQIQFMNEDNSIVDFLVIDNENIKNALSAPLKIFLEVTSICNLSCKHCFNSTILKRPMNELTTLEIKDIVEQAKKIGVVEFKITGGEPFLRSDLFEILEFIDSKNIKITLHTNGYFINESNAKKLNKLKNLKSVKLSLDGDIETNDEIRGNGCYVRVREAADVLNKENVPCAINYTITKNNYLSIGNVINEFTIGKRIDISIGVCKLSGQTITNLNFLEFENNVDFCNAMKFVDDEIQKFQKIESTLNIQKPIKIYKEKEELPNFLNKNFGCVAGIASMTINSEGEVFPCGLLSNSDGYRCGNVREKNIIEIWKDSKPMNIMRYIEPNYKCKSCKFLYKKCFGGCRGNAYNVNNDIAGIDPHCLYNIYNV